MQLSSEELTSLKEGLRSLPDLKAPESLSEPSAEMILALSELEKSAIENPKLEDSVSSIQQITFWRRTSFALAASLLLMFGAVGYLGLESVQNLSPVELTQEANSDSDLDKNARASALKLLIEMNQILQSKIEESPKLVNVASRQKKYYQRKLDKIDDAIQQAYLSRLSEEEKMGLWQERLNILKILEKQKAQKKSNRTIRI